MSTTNRADGKTTIVVLASEPSCSAFGNMVRKWLVCAICALAAVAMNAMWITSNAYGDNSGDSSDSSSSSTDSGVTITENITDTENLLGSHAAKVTDAIAKTEKETGVHVHLLYLSSFNSQQKPEDWAATVMESMNPKPNTVMLAVASNDGNLVVVVSKNSDKWLLDNKTVDKLSEAAQQPLLENPPSWSGAATAMMDQIVKSKKASTSSSTVTVGIIIMGVVLVALVIIIVVMVVIRRRKEITKDSKAELQDYIQETPRRARHSRRHE
ncbi:TPM domain-containing protein [Bifidobacterium longum subsp. infantis]|nr:TPM domain-containing protein [Bifidobacterium longum subsp. infantis]MED7619676.1 TPM domain-containing protein [Bifidobacterium longum subsp. infantis]